MVNENKGIISLLRRQTIEDDIQFLCRERRLSSELQDIKYSLPESVYVWMFERESDLGDAPR
jgi:hypothetical protein